MKSVAQLKRDFARELTSDLHSMSVEWMLTQFLRQYEAIKRKRQERFSDLACHGRALNTLRRMSQAEREFRYRD